MIISNSFRDGILSKITFLQKQKFNSIHSNYWNITDEQGIFLSNLVDFKKPNSILEIGTSNGFSGLWLNLNLSIDSSFTTVEVDKTRFELAKANFSEVGLKNFNCVNSDALEYLSTCADKFDLLFVDAGHCLYQDILDLLISSKLLFEKCILIFDNVTSHSQLDGFVKSCFDKFDCELINIGGGMLVINL
jgi:predicted O-methyltransferase YrrM